MNKTLMALNGNKRSDGEEALVASRQRNVKIIELQILNNLGQST